MVKVGNFADFKIWQDMEGKLYCFPEVVSRGELMRFTEVCIDEDGIVIDVADTDIRLTRSDCRKKGFGSFDNILSLSKKQKEG